MQEAKHDEVGLCVQRTASRAVSAVCIGRFASMPKTRDF